MIITIICIALLIIGVVLVIIGDQQYTSTVSNVGLITGAIGAFGTFICIMLCLLSNSTRSKMETYSQLYNSRESLNATYEYLNSEELTSHSITEITTYNTKVAEYKSSIETNQNGLDNPWINWFFCTEYDKFSVEDVQFYKGTK